MMNQPQPEDTSPEERPRGKPGPEPKMKGGRARSLYLSAALWESIPAPRSKFLRGALTAYLQESPAELEAAAVRGPGGQFASQDGAPDRKYVGAYLPDDLYTRLKDLPGSATVHLEAALAAALKDEDA